MVKHLDFDYEIEEKPTGLIPHFWDTIEALGGFKGIFLITLGVLLFYGIVIYVVTTGRLKRQKKKN